MGGGKYLPLRVEPERAQPRERAGQKIRAAKKATYRKRVKPAVYPVYPARHAAGRRRHVREFLAKDKERILKRSERASKRASEEKKGKVKAQKVVTTTTTTTVPGKRDRPGLPIREFYSLSRSARTRRVVYLPTRVPLTVPNGSLSPNPLALLIKGRIEPFSTSLFGASPARVYTAPPPPPAHPNLHVF